MIDPTRLAIVGAGLIGRRHAEVIRQLPDVERIAIVDPGDSGRAYAAEHGLPWFETLSAMFNEVEPDGIVLSTPTPLHVTQGLECVARGRPILVEKPIATSTCQARALVQAANTANVPLLVGHHRRHNPRVHKAREIIEAGTIGDIRVVHANCWFYKPNRYFDVAPWRKRKGAGPISVNLVHDVDLLRHLCGEVVSVRAQAAPSARGYENEDVAAAVLRFESGAIGTISVSDAVVAPWSWELTSREYPVYPATSQSCYMIGGSRGSLSLPDLTVWTQEGERDWWNPITATTGSCDSSNPLTRQIVHFAAVIAGTEQPAVSGLEGLRTLQVVEAIQVASQSTGCVDVDPEASPLDDGNAPDPTAAGEARVESGPRAEGVGKTPRETDDTHHLKSPFA